jgi:hypothetical protein
MAATMLASSLAFIDGPVTDVAYRPSARISAAAVAI